MKKEYSLALGERTAEEIKIALGSAYPLEEELYAEVRGRDLVTGLPKTIVVSTEEIREAIEEPVAAIVDAVKVTLDKTPPELAADIMANGIVVTGGGALLHGLERAARRPRPACRSSSPTNPLLLGRARFRAVPRELRRAQARPELAHPAIAGTGRERWRVPRRASRRRFVLALIVLTCADADHPRHPQRPLGPARGGRPGRAHGSSRRSRGRSTTSPARSATGGAASPTPAT